MVIPGVKDLGLDRIFTIFLPILWWCSANSLLPKHGVVGSQEGGGRPCLPPAAAPIGRFSSGSGELAEGSQSELFNKAEKHVRATVS